MWYLNCLLLFQGLFLINLIGAEDPPGIEIVGENPQVVDGNGKAKTTCLAKGLADGEQPNLKWYNSTQQITMDISSSMTVFSTPSRPDKLDLFIDPVQEYMSGLYVCNGTINGQVYSANFQLSVRIPLEVDSTACPRTATAIKGKDVTIKCAGPQSYSLTWYSPSDNTAPVQGDHPRYSEVQGGLLITDVQESDEGTFTVLVFKDDVPSLRITIDLTVYVEPTFTLEPATQQIETGSECRMECFATGKPEPVYSWFKGGSGLALTGDRYEIGTTTGIFLIKSVILDDKGDYQCRATNEAGAVTSTARLTVIVPPEIRQFDNTTGDEGTSATMKCRAYGIPMPSITFMRDGIPLTSTDASISITSNTDTNTMERTSSLTISNLVAANNGFITCSADNDASTVGSGSAYLTVRYKPIFDTKKTNISVYAWEGNPGYMTCVVTGVPIPSVIWKKGNSTDSLQSGHYQVIDRQSGVNEFTSTLSVKIDYSNADQTFGEYTCEARNDIGSTSHTVSLNKANRPPKPAVSQVGDSPTPRTVEFQITVTKVSNGPDPTSIEIKWYLKNNAGQNDEYKTIPVVFYDNENRKVISVDDINTLTPATTYTFEIVSISSIGKSDVNSFDITTPQKRAPYKMEYQMARPECEYSRKCLLQWEIPKDGGEDIISIKVDYRQVSVQSDRSPTTNEFQLKEPIGAWFLNLQPLQGKPTSYMLENLNPGTYYEVQVSATNSKGSSDPQNMIILTEIGNDGLPLGVVIAIIIIAFLVLFIIVDVTCYYTRKCGVLKCIKDKLDGEGSGETTRIKAAEEGDGENKEPLLKNGKSEESAAEEDGTTKGEVKEMEPEDKEEKIEKPPTPDEKADVEVAEEAKPDDSVKPTTPAEESKEAPATEDGKKEGGKEEKS